MESQLWVALILGLTGSLGHCFGMCGGISLMLGLGIPGGERRLDSRVVMANLGRVTTYTFLGVSAGIVGGALSAATVGMSALQGVLAIFAAGFAIYTAAALIGRAPSPDTLLHGVTGRWGRVMQATVNAAVGFPYVTGLVWGFLPCGLVLLALVGAASTASPVSGALVMLAFGAGTIPAMLGVGTLARVLKRPAGDRRSSHWGFIAAGIVALFAMQMFFRALAAWGFIDHLSIGDVVLW